METSCSLGKRRKHCSLCILIFLIRESHRQMPLVLGRLQPRGWPAAPAAGSGSGAQSGMQRLLEVTAAGQGALTSGPRGRCTVRTEGAGWGASQGASVRCSLQSVGTQGPVEATQSPRQPLWAPLPWAEKAEAQAEPREEGDFSGSIRAREGIPGNRCTCTARGP